MAVAAASAGLALLSTPAQVATAAGYIVAKEISAMAFSATTNRLTDVLSRLSKYDSDAAKTAHVQLARLIPTSKIQITRAMMADFEALRTNSKTVNALLQALDDSACTITTEAYLVEIAIKEHPSKWFASLRGLDIEHHLDQISASVAALESNFALLAQLLPSCVIAIAATAASVRSDNKDSNKIGAPILLALTAPPENNQLNYL
jgi:hypothetical protein